MSFRLRCTFNGNTTTQHEGPLEHCQAALRRIAFNFLSEGAYEEDCPQGTKDAPIRQFAPHRKKTINLRESSMVVIDVSDEDEAPFRITADRLDYFIEQQVKVWELA